MRAVGLVALAVLSGCANRASPDTEPKASATRSALDLARWVHSPNIDLPAPGPQSVASCRGPVKVVPLGADQLLLTWVNEVAARPGIYASRVDSTLEPLDYPPIAISTTATTPAAVACQGDTCVHVWSDAGKGYVRFLENGQIDPPAKPVVQLDATTWDPDPQLVATASGFLLVYHTTSDEIVAQPLPLDGDPPAATTLLPAPAGALAAVARSGSIYLLVTNTDGKPSARRFTSELQIVDAAATPLADTALLDVAAGDDGFALVYGDGNVGFNFRTLSSGLELGSVSNFPSRSGVDVRLLRAEGGWGIFYRSPQMALKRSYLADGGKWATTELGLVSDDGAFVGSSFDAALATWGGAAVVCVPEPDVARRDNHSVVARKLTTVGEATGETVQAALEPAEQAFFQVEASKVGYLVQWEEGGVWHRRVVAARINLEGQVLDDPALTFDEGNLVSWTSVAYDGERIAAAGFDEAGNAHLSLRSSAAASIAELDEPGWTYVVAGQSGFATVSFTPPAYGSESGQSSSAQVLSSDGQVLATHSLCSYRCATPGLAAFGNKYLVTDGSVDGPDAMPWTAWFLDGAGTLSSGPSMTGLYGGVLTNEILSNDVGFGLFGADFPTYVVRDPLSLTPISPVGQLGTPKKFSIGARDLVRSCYGEGDEYRCFFWKPDGSTYTAHLGGSALVDVEEFDAEANKLLGLVAGHEPDAFLAVHSEGTSPRRTVLKANLFERERAPGASCTADWQCGALSCASGHCANADAANGCAGGSETAAQPDPAGATSAPDASGGDNDGGAASPSTDAGSDAGGSPSAPVAVSAARTSDHSGCGFHPTAPPKSTTLASLFGWLLLLARNHRPTVRRRGGRALFASRP